MIGYAYTEVGIEVRNIPLREGSPLSGACPPGVPRAPGGSGYGNFGERVYGD